MANKAFNNFTNGDTDRNTTGMEGITQGKCLFEKKS